MEFEWDEEKNKINIQKHGIAFEDALKVFLDPYRVYFYDSAHSSIQEERWQTIGCAFSNILFVIYTFRDEKEIYRIISARKANAREKRKYYQG